MFRHVYCAFLLFCSVLAPNMKSDDIGVFPGIRWSQTAGFGFVPNQKMPQTFMAVAMDLPDYNSPYKPYVYICVMVIHAHSTFTYIPVVIFCLKKMLQMIYSFSWFGVYVDGQKGFDIINEFINKYGKAKTYIDV